MNHAIRNEMIRQCLRWVAILLATIGMPANLTAFLGDPETVNWVAAAVAYGTAEGGWLISKWRAAK